ncbi:MAG: hypothetical protein AB1442_14465 [Nitrospirota bacterium]
MTRIFSISLSYHFAFMVVSTAMLGIGASGTMLYAYPRLRDTSRIGAYSLFLGLGILLSYAAVNQLPFDPVNLLWSKTHILYLGLYPVILSIPFFFAGLIVASALSSFPDAPGCLYGADLLGAGAGSLGILYLAGMLGPDSCVVAISSLPIAAAILWGGRRTRIAAPLLFLVIAVVLHLNPELLEIRMSPYKGLQSALKYPGAEHLKTYVSPYSRIDVFRSPASRFAPGLSLRYLDALPEQIGLSIDGGQMNAITGDGGGESPAFLGYLPSALPYELVNSSSNKEDAMRIGQSLNEVLVLDPKGGLQVLVARHYGADMVQKIESNPLIVEVIDKDFFEFSGGIYSSDTTTGLGRSWLKHGRRQFDIVDISLTGASPGGSFGILEDYRFTVEAFKEYLRHLNTGGFLSVNLFIIPPPRTELRILLTGIAAMEELGITEINKNITAMRSIETLCILIKKSPLTADEIGRLRKFSEDRRFDLVYYPGISAGESNRFVRMPSDEYFHAFQRLVDKKDRPAFVRSYLFDIEPVRDESPFFHYYLKLNHIKEIYSVMGEKWQFFVEEGYVLPIVFVQVFVASVILILLPIFVGRKEKGGPDLFFLSYFALLGLGFMFVEVPLIQKMILPLEHPSYAFAAVLTSVLISSGAGSLSSHKIRGLRTPFELMAIAVIVIVWSFLIPAISDIMSLRAMSSRIFLTFLLFFPLGFLMGIPFPAGLAVLSQRNAALIPWAWAVNGCFSVLAPILATMIAMTVGFKAVLWLGSLAYLLAFSVLIFAFRSPRPWAQKPPVSTAGRQDHPSSS